MTPEEFQFAWDTLVAMTAEKHPDADLADWLRHEARGVITTECDPDLTKGRVEWVA